MYLTKEDVNEFEKCRNDIVYFTEKYIRYQTIDGVKDLKLYPYQVEVLPDNRLTASTSRQIGFTLLSYVKIIHSLIFNSDKTILFYTIKRDRFSYSLQTIADMLGMCSFLMKPEIISKTKDKLQLDNGMRLLGGSTYGHIRGYAISEIYMEEVDYYKDDIDEILHVIMPSVMTSENFKFWAWTTEANGNLETMRKRLGNKFSHYNLPWYVIPDRTSDWKNQFVNNMGKEQFDNEYNNKMT
jgi:hypothetical protein